MTLVQLVILIVVVGILLAIVNAAIPMQANIKRILNIVIVAVIGIVALVWLLQFAGLSGDITPRRH